MDKNYNDNDNRNVEFKQMMDECNELPGRLDYIKTRIKVRAKGRKRAIFAGSFAGSIAALFLCFVLAINTSTAFAQTMYDIPALRKLVESVYWNNSLQKAYENDYAQYIGIKSKSGDNELELAYVMEDKSHLIMVFRFTKLDESLKGKQLSICDKYINDISTGENISMNGQVPGGRFDENELITLSRILDESSFHSDLDVQINLYKEEESDTGSCPVDTVGYFNFKFHVKETVKEKVYALNKTIEIGQQKVCLESLVVYPTCSIATFKKDDSNTELIQRIEVALIDESGQELPMGEGITTTRRDLAEKGYMKFFLSSDYYSSSGSLTLIVKCAYMLPKNMVNVTIDLNKGVITDSTGIVQDMKISEVEDKGETIKITLDCDKDFQVMLPALGGAYRFSDGTEFYLQSGSSMIGDNGHYNEYLFDVTKPKDGIIKVDRQLARYKADLNIKVPIR